MRADLPPNKLGGWAELTGIHGHPLCVASASLALLLFDLQPFLVFHEGNYMVSRTEVSKRNQTCNKGVRPRNRNNTVHQKRI